MILATTLSVIQTILTAIETLDELTLFDFDVVRQLGDLHETVRNVKAELEDAESRQDALSSQEKNYFEEISAAVYETDAALDQFVTLLQQKQAKINQVNVTRPASSDKVLSQVKSFQSGSTNYIDSSFDRIKQVKNKFDDIFSKKKKLIKSLNRESSSFKWVNDPIIGRDGDLEEIINMLFNQQYDVSSIAIVGMGGLGKTALAQLVYNDPRIASEFPLRSWTCIADHDQEQWNLTNLLRKIVGNFNTHNFTSFGQMYSEFMQKVEGKKFLLVLDDVWTESYSRWKELEKYLMVGQSGSRIIVTTRSKNTARIVGGFQVYELGGLSEEYAWLLFERMAFRPEQRVYPYEHFVKLGKDIVKRCSNVPLAIRVVGSLLHGESKRKWESFRYKELANINQNDDFVNKLLSLSYHQLDSSLKSCFRYCAICPKDFEIDKQMLIRLWMAQGYVNEQYEGEAYVHILLQRCFFQDVKVDDMSNIISFKIHDLLHDVAEQGAGKVSQLSLLYGFFPKVFNNKTNICTCLLIKENIWSMTRLDPLLASYLIVNWSSLRSLHLSSLQAERLPESIHGFLQINN